MRVRMKTRLAGPEYNCAPGGEIDVPDAMGADLCAGGYAEPVHSAPAEQAVEPAAEAREVAVAPAAPRANAPRKPRGR